MAFASHVAQNPLTPRKYMFFFAEKNLREIAIKHFNLAFNFSL